ncbi:substrate-binding domain-containing protein [Burkholderia thailandensis]|uniref:substrate-binding domain-containing protein n=1 Tax=Burkholderia thailandensis TaxID=57975 RepID=UPI003B9844A5
MQTPPKRPILEPQRCSFLPTSAGAYMPEIPGSFMPEGDTRRAAQAYLDYLYSPAAQEIVARHHLRPRDAAVLRKHASEFKPLKTFTVEQIFGNWANAQKTHFADGGTFDKIIVDRR